MNEKRGEKGLKVANTQNEVERRYITNFVATWSLIAMRE
jgi:hypothetical protein